jgi:hypothetical protein
MTFPFCETGYTNLVQFLRDHGYRVASFQEGAPLLGRERVCLLRHDVDHSLQAALTLARLEAKLGVCATYFVMLHGDFYSPCSRAGESALREIAGFGHEVGFHWWQSRYAPQQADFERQFRQHLDLLAWLTGKSVCSAAQHDPTGESPRDLKHLVAYNAYERRFFKELVYISDSNRQFRTAPESLPALGCPNLQLNLHPLYWVTGGSSMASCVRLAFAAETANQWQTMEETVAYYESCLKDRSQRDKNFRDRIQGAA